MHEAIAQQIIILRLSNHIVVGRICTRQSAHYTEDT